MKIDTNHLHHWMRAIRESKDPVRTLDAFWQGQIQSKEWLIDSIKPFISKEISIDIHGGWVGVLSSMLFQSGLLIKYIRSIDIDPMCESVANNMNQIEFESGKFKAITADMCTISSNADVIINTSCEHITQHQYDQWLNGLPKKSLIVLQSNNYSIEEHIRTANSLEDFKSQSRLKNIFYTGEKQLSLYTRFMLIGNNDD